MGRELKRVPMDFNWPIGEVWEGYCPTMETFRRLFGEKYKYLYSYNSLSCICAQCEVNNGKCFEAADYCLWHNPANKNLWFKEVPSGNGYQLWENTTEGSPKSPVFATLDDLCEWCADNATTFASFTATKEEWKQMLDDGLVSH